MKKLIYFHGFASSHASHTVELLRNITCPITLSALMASID